MPLDFLKSSHPIWDANHEEWERRERLLRGGVDVIAEELPKFAWEVDGDESHKQRQREAVYPGFGEAYVRTLIGHVLKDRPEADAGLQMGAMGEVKRAENVNEPSQAEQVFYNVNGTGGDGQQLWQWLASVFGRAGATGLRWVLVEAPSGMAASRSDELAGQRPYAVEFSPRSVTNWKFERGQLQWCVIKIRQDTRRVENGAFSGAANEEGTYLLVRVGVTSLGAEFAQGGWWKFDKDGNQLDAGSWAKTQGEIPISLAVWEWETAPVDEEALPLARSATTALDNLSVGYMNLTSAWRSNAWRSAGGPDYLLGVDGESAWPIVKAQYEAGTGLIGVPLGRDNTTAPTLAHSSGALVNAQSFKAALDDMTAEAERMMVQQATSAPESSGASKEAGFTESKAPRLVMLSENMESFLNTLLRFFELRFGHPNPSAYVQMPRQFDLAPVEEDIKDFFDTFRRTSLRSATLETKAILQLGEAKGLVDDKDREAIRGELTDSARASVTAGAQEGNLFGDLFGGAGAAGGEAGAAA